MRRAHLLPLLLCAALLPIFGRPALAVDVVRVPSPVSAQDLRRDYSWQLLIEVLRRTEPAYGPFQLVQADIVMNRRRLLPEMRAGLRVNVVANAADAEWLSALKAVAVPIDMGLKSWRIALVRRSEQERLNALHTPAELKALRFGSASAWVSRRALEDSGFTIVTGEDYEGLFNMLIANRFDLLPRGVNEIFPEYDLRSATAPELAVEQRFLLHDHITSLFFVSPAAPRLAKRLGEGMEAMLKDGSLRRFVLAHYGDALRRARLCERTVVELPRPPLPPKLANRPDLWFDPLDPANGICPTRPAVAASSTP